MFNRMGESKAAIVAAICANAIIAAAKLTAGFLAGSSAMVAEGIHSVVDSANGSLLLIGRRLAQRPPDRAHPLGHSRDAYVWSLIVAVLVFSVGGGMSVYEGVVRMVGPDEPLHLWLTYAVLGGAGVVEGISFWFSARAMRKARGQMSVWRAIRRLKDPAVFSVYLEDSVDLIGLAVAFAGVTLTRLTGSRYFDASASVVIGLILGAVAIILVSESRKLLLGEAADPEVVDAVLEVSRADPAVAGVACPLAIQIGPREVAINLRVDFQPSMVADEITAAARRLTRSIRERLPEAKHVFIGLNDVGGRVPCDKDQGDGPR